MKLVLGVARPVPEAADEPDQLRVESRHAQRKGGLFPRLSDLLVNLLLDLFHDLFDAGGVDPAIDDEALHGNPRDLSADRVEARKDHRLRRVVHDDIDPGGFLEGPDVAPFPADDPPLHVITGQSNHRDGRLGDKIRRTPIDGDGQDLLGLAVRRLLRLILDAPDEGHRLQAGLALHVPHQHPLGLLRGHPRNAFEVLPLLRQERLDLVFTLSKLLIPTSKVRVPAADLLLPTIQMIQFAL